MKKVIVITSGKGGVGTTTSAINLGAALNYFGKDVLIVDANLTTPNIGIFLNSPEVPICLNHVLQNKADVFEAVYEHDSGLKIIPSSISIKELKKIRPEKIKNFKKDFEDIADYVIIDSAAGLGVEAKQVIGMADEIILITNPEMPAITDALKTIKLAEEMKKPIKGVIITRYQGDRLDMSLDNIKEMLESEILGIIPEDASVKESQIMKNALLYTHPNSKALKNYINTSRKILGKPVEKELGWFGRLLRNMGL